MDKRREDRDHCSCSTSRKLGHPRSVHPHARDVLEVLRAHVMLLGDAQERLFLVQLGFLQDVVLQQLQVRLVVLLLLRHALLVLLLLVLRLHGLLLQLFRLRFDLSQPALLVLS